MKSDTQTVLAVQSWLLPGSTIVITGVHSSLSRAMFDKEKYLEKVYNLFEKCTFLINVKKKTIIFDF